MDAGTRVLVLCVTCLMSCLLFQVSEGGSSPSTTHTVPKPTSATPLSLDDLKVSKRHVGAFLRLGHQQDKRQLASLARNGDFTTFVEMPGIRPEPEDLLEEDEEDNYGRDAQDKRHLGSLVRTGGYSSFDPSYVRTIGKRFLGSLARSGDLGGKRNIASLARGGYGKRDDDEVFDSSELDKRQLSSLARNGDLMYNNRLPEGKRYLGSLARNGAYYRQNSENKRYLGALARGGGLGKRFLGSIAASGGIPITRIRKSSPCEDCEEHSNEAKVDGGSEHNAENAKVSSEQKTTKGAENAPEDLDRFKRNIASLARSSHLPVVLRVSATPRSFLSTTEDDEDVTPGSEEPVGSVEKRFLGSLVRGGWFPRQFRGYMFGAGSQQKRHIGSLARLGWLPALRSSRNFPDDGKRNIQSLARQGHTRGSKRTGDLGESGGQLEVVGEEPYNEEDDYDEESDEDESSWEEEPFGWEGDQQVIDEGPQQHYFLSNKSPSTLVANKRYLLLPAIDNLLLRRLYPRRFGKRLQILSRLAHQIDDQNDFGA